MFQKSRLLTVLLPFLRACSRPGLRVGFPCASWLLAFALLLLPAYGSALGAPEVANGIASEEGHPESVLGEQLWAARGKSFKKPHATVPRASDKARKQQATQAPKPAQAEQAPSKSKTGGETAATKRGREAHIAWDPGPGFEKEVTLPSGKRADAVSLEGREVKELKPDNPRAIKRGERQVEEYRQELEKDRGGKWKGKVETYKP